MIALLKKIALISLFVVAHSISAQNTDILWQKTLTKDTIPISSLAIAEGKYVAALKGGEIIILDYTTGDSIKSFPKPSDMYGNDIILGKNGERLYILRAKRPDNYFKYDYCRLFSWDLSTGTEFNDTVFGSQNGRNLFIKLSSFHINASLDGKYIALGCNYDWVDLNSGPEISGSDLWTRFITTLNSINPNNSNEINARDSNSYSISTLKKYGSEILGGANSSSFSFSPSGNYYQYSYSSSEYHHISGGHDMFENFHYGHIKSLISNLPSYDYKYELPFYIFSSNDNFVLDGNNIKDIPPAQTIRTLNKIGFVFLPDDNHMLAFHAAGGVAAISNIQEDTWEKVFVGDSLAENIIQTNASRSGFATATNNRITFWKVPDTLKPANLAADFQMSKDSIPISDTISFTNRTFPIRRGAYFEWNFGDGSPISKEQHPIHIFNVVGTFTVSLKVLDSIGNTSTATKIVFVHDYKIPDNALWVNRLNENTINCLSYSPDGQMISSGSYGVAAIWNAETSKLLKSTFFKAFTFSTIFTKDGKSITVGTLLYDKAPRTMFNFLDKYQNYMSLWNLATDSLVPILTWDVVKDNEARYFDIKQFYSVSDLSEDNKWYLTGHGIIADWTNAPPEINGFEKYIHPNQHIGNLLCYNFTAKTSRYYLSPISKSNFPSSDPNVSSFPPIRSVRILSNSQQYVSIVESKDNSPVLLFRDIVTDSIYRKISVTATSMHFSPDKFHLLTNTGLWNVYDSILVKTVDLPLIFEYHPDGIHVFTLRQDSTIGIYNLNTNSYEYLYPKQSTVFTALAVAPDGKHIATGDKNGYITVWNVPDSLKTSIKADFNTTLLKRTNLTSSDTIVFTNTTLPVNNTFDFLWNFGDGTTSIERNPKHKYLKAGKYTVTLSALQNGNIIDSIIKPSYVTIVGVLVAEELKIELETSFSVIPNPSYGETTFNYALSQPSVVHIRITDILGREVNSWVLQEQAGKHSFSWANYKGIGIYYCTFSTGNTVRTIPYIVTQ